MNEKEFIDEDLALIDRSFEELEEASRKRIRFPRELDVIRSAYEFANNAHRNVRRRSGEPYMLHPLAVAKIVVNDIGLGYKSIAAALLHDVVEDTEYTTEDIRSRFGDKIASLVDGLTKITGVLDKECRPQVLDLSESLQAENMKRILLSLCDDARVVLIKMADRLHNCRTIQYMPENKRDKILSETKYIFIPLAHRLGLYSIKTEMENIWLKYKEPKAFEEISRRINLNVESNQKAIDDFIAPISGVLRRNDVDFTIKQRIKTPYSIWNKMVSKNIPFEQIYDLYAVRIVFNPSSDDIEAERKQAYMIYADILGLYKEKPGRHRDWIVSPKSNGYEALHSTMMSQAGIWIEVQIRSKRMDDIAEKGIAAHWTYKRNGYASENDSEMDKWMEKVTDMLDKQDVNTLELLDIIHSDLVSTDIVVFTPKGEQRTVANGATALDFAYAIHTNIGLKAVAAKVNMKLAPLSHVLRPGDQVEIVTSGTAEPKPEQLQFLKTRKAKTIVVDYFRKDKEVFIADGKKLLESRLASVGIQDTNEIRKRFITYFQVHDISEVYFRAGLGLLTPSQFKMVVYDVIEDSSKDITDLVCAVDGREGLKYMMSACCNPIPGDDIVGFLLDGVTVHVHKKTCEQTEYLGSTFGKNTIALKWISEDRDFPVRITITGIDRIGLVSDITQFISHVGVNMTRLQLGSKSGVFEGYIEMLVRDKEKLDKMIEGLCHIDGVQDVVRTNI